jgi:large subunit ribosomal protein L4
MAQHDVIDLTGKKVGSIELNDAVFAAPIRRYLLTEIVHWQRAKRRRGTQEVKTKAEVNGTTKKPHGQKHTGNARQGSYKNPHMVGGGVAFAPKPRDYGYALPRAKRRIALAVALSVKVKEQGFKVVRNFELSESKTKGVISVLKALGAPQALIVDGDNEKLNLSTRNLTDSRYLHHNGLNVMDLLRYPTLVITESAVKAVEQRLTGEGAE